MAIMPWGQPSGGGRRGPSQHASLPPAWPCPPSGLPLSAWDAWGWSVEAPARQSRGAALPESPGWGGESQTCLPMLGRGCGLSASLQPPEGTL